MKILVTGSNGQVGNAIKQLVRNSKHEFLFTDRNSLDICDESQINSFFNAHNPDIVVNTAAYTAVDNAETDSEACYAVNEMAVKHLAKALSKYNRKHALFIHISSDYVYHPSHSDPIVEEETTNPKGIYAASKLAGDQTALIHFDNTVIVRTSWVYAKEGGNFVNTMKRLCSERPNLNVVADQIGSPTYAPDIAQTIVDIIDNFQKTPSTFKSGIYNFSNDGFTSWYEFASEINQIIQGNCQINPIPTSEYPTPASRPLNSRLNKSKIQNTFNIKLKHWKDSLRKCLTE